MLYREERIYIRTEPCDCGEQIRHNNGGNYHREFSIYEISCDDKWCIVQEKTTSREDFPGEKWEYLILRDGEFVVMEEEGMDLSEIQCLRILSDGKQQRSFPFRAFQGELEILAQGDGKTISFQD